MRINWKGKQDLALLVRAGYASTEERMMGWCALASINPTRLVEEIGRETVEYWANYWTRR